MKGKPLPPIPRGCSAASPEDSRGPGWYCCKDNVYNSGAVCRVCGHRRCSEKDPE